MAKTKTKPVVVSRDPDVAIEIVPCDCGNCDSEVAKFRLLSEAAVGWARRHAINADTGDTVGEDSRGEVLTLTARDPETAGVLMRSMRHEGLNVVLIEPHNLALNTLRAIN
jgi:hypothetical protein